MFVIKPIEGHFRVVFSPTHASTPSIANVAAYVAAALRSSYAAEPKLLFLASCGNAVFVITSDQALSNSIGKTGIDMALRLCTPATVASSLRITNVGGIHVSHLREMLSAFGAVKSLRMVATTKQDSEPVYGTSALASVIANTAIPPSLVCEVDGLRLTLTISAPTFASAARRRHADREPAQLRPPGEDIREQAAVPAELKLPAGALEPAHWPHAARKHVACRDWARGQCQRGPACRFSHSGKELKVVKDPARAVRNEDPENCRDFARGRCSRNHCKFSHGQPVEAKAIDAETRKKLTVVQDPRSRSSSSLPSSFPSSSPSSSSSPPPSSLSSEPKHGHFIHPHRAAQILWPPERAHARQVPPHPKRAAGPPSATPAAVPAAALTRGAVPSAAPESSADASESAACVSAAWTPERVSAAAARPAAAEDKSAAAAEPAERPSAGSSSSGCAGSSVSGNAGRAGSSSSGNAASSVSGSAISDWHSGSASARKRLRRSEQSPKQPQCSTGPDEVPIRIVPMDDDHLEGSPSSSTSTSPATSPRSLRTSSPTPAKSEDLAEASSRQ